MNFATLQGLTIPDGVVTQIADASGGVLWKLATKKPAILEVAKSATTSKAGETEYTDESVILLDIYPEKYATIKVTYGGLTKTVTDTSGADEPNALQVFFGTFQGVSDSVTTPESGTVTIEGNYRGYGRGSFTNTKSLTAYCACITGVQEIGEPSIIGAYTFYQCTNLALTSLPDTVTYIGENAFYQCTNLALTSLPDTVTYIGGAAFYECYYIDVRNLPQSLTEIGDEAFYMGNGPSLDNGYVSVASIAMHGAIIVFPSGMQTIGNGAFALNETNSDGSEQYNYISGIKMLGETPPVISESSFDGFDWYQGDGSGNAVMDIIVPSGCIENYKTAEVWSTYANYITEAS